MDEKTYLNKLIDENNAHMAKAESKVFMLIASNIFIFSMLVGQLSSVDIKYKKIVMVVSIASSLIIIHALWGTLPKYNSKHSKIVGGNYSEEEDTYFKNIASKSEESFINHYRNNKVLASSAYKLCILTKKKYDLARNQSIMSMILVVLTTATFIFINY